MFCLISCLCYFEFLLLNASNIWETIRECCMQGVWFLWKIETAPGNRKTAPKKLQNEGCQKLFLAPERKSLLSSPCKYLHISWKENNFFYTYLDGYWRIQNLREMLFYIVLTCHRQKKAFKIIKEFHLNDKLLQLLFFSENMHYEIYSWWINSKCE